ncbi:MAG: selenocysteine-specific translation elongation factor [Candidatus Villigracilaceae bacterium]
MRVIGTAGHVDHGKSTLVEALTGTHPDRLKEEQQREMTIELGFGWMTLPDGEEIGIVDVPGHRDFIENMLAGVGGIDAALLVIAADEGVMPQTKEHLAILDLLQISTGVIAITKTDLVSDAEWLDLVESEIRSTLKGSTLENAPLVRVSAKTRAGLDHLVIALNRALQQKPVRRDIGRPRLPVDRAFSMPGFGTVVTGTLSDGRFQIGEEVEILPAGHRGRIRGLQTHKKKEEIALPGSRTAVNISGLTLTQVRRGDVVAHPGQYQPTRRLDARLRLLNDISAPLHHASEVKFFVGAAETMARVRLLGVDTLAPGQEGWVQIELRKPVVTVRGDRFILRRPSPAETLGGGLVVDAQPAKRHKPSDKAILRHLEALLHGSPTDILFQTSLQLNAAPIKEVIACAQLDAAQAQAALQELLQSRQILLLETGTPTAESDLLVMAQPHWQDLQNRALQTLNAYHNNYPLQQGMPREEFKSRLKLSPRLFNALLTQSIARGTLVEQNGRIALPGHAIKLNGQQQAQVQNLMRKFEQNPYNPPSVKECQAEVGEEVYHALLELGELIAVSSEVVFRPSHYADMVAKIRQTLQAKGQITLAETRDLFGTSRKYAQALLEHLDAGGVTVRQGDYRKLRA